MENNPGTDSTRPARPIDPARRRRLRRIGRVIGVPVLAGVLAVAVPVILPAIRLPADQVQVVALGDSVPAGTGCGCRAFPQRYGRALQQRDGRTVGVRNDAVAGLTAAQLLQALEDPDSRMVKDVRRADVVLLTVGANDLGAAFDQWSAGGCATACYRPLVARMGTTLQQILGAVHRLDRRRGASVLVTTYWNVFQDGAVALAEHGAGYLAWSDDVTRSANAAICAAARVGSARCVDLYGPFKQGGQAGVTALLADDADHPDAGGHALIARTLLAATPGVRVATVGTAANPGIPVPSQRTA